jgi:hypothetical protein
VYQAAAAAAVTYCLAHVLAGQTAAVLTCGPAPTKLQLTLLGMLLLLLLLLLLQVLAGQTAALICSHATTNRATDTL